MSVSIATEAGGPDEAVDVAIRPMLSDDLRRIADLQLVTLPNDVWSKLGGRFLRLCYEEFLEREHIAFVTSRRGSVLGFVAGSLRPDRFFRRLLKRRLLGLLLACAFAGLRQPGLSVRIVRGLFERPKVGSPPGQAVLMYMAVDPVVQDRGIGRMLADAFIEEAAQRGAPSVRLRTDKVGNERANAFYRGLGFAFRGERLSVDLRAQNEYEIAIRGDRRPRRSDVSDDSTRKRAR